MRHQATLCLGSNTPDRAMQLAKAIALIEKLCPNECSFSSCYESAAEGVERPQSPYLNCVAVVETTLSYNELNAKLKELEQQAGRTPADKATGRVPLDIDIVVWNGEVVRPTDWESGYFRHGLAELAT